MNYKEVMSELKKLGTAQNVKVYKRHGVKGKHFGVSMADITRLKKKIKTDTGLARKLWDTGVLDARILAMLIADPQEFTSAQADKWVKEVDFYMLGDYLAAVVAQAPFALQKLEKWTKSKQEFVRACGYSILSAGLRDGAEISNAECEKHLKNIEKQIHDSPNRARYSMNNALISIGAYKSDLSDSAIATARRIGRVEVDHGETSCKTPDAVSYIQKCVQRRERTSTKKPFTRR